jgi:hypothetical protein
MTRTAALPLIIVALAAAAGCSAASTPAASAVAPGSAAVPCSAIAGQVRYLAQFVTIRLNAPPYPDNLYALEVKLADRFGNVSNLDEPQALSRAETDFEIAVDDTPSGVGPQFPVTDEVMTAFGKLAQSCGIAD